MINFTFWSQSRTKNETILINHDIFTLVQSLTVLGKISFIFEHVSFYVCLFLNNFVMTRIAIEMRLKCVCLPRMRIRCVVGVQRWRITCQSLRREYFRCFYTFHGSSLPFANFVWIFFYKFTKGREKQWIRHRYRSISRRIRYRPTDEFAPWKNCFFGLFRSRRVVNWKQKFERRLIREY